MRILLGALALPLLPLSHTAVAQIAPHPIPQTAAACQASAALIKNISYCGATAGGGGGGGGGGGSTGGTDNRVACNYYVKATGGSDSFSGTSVADAFATLGKLQTTLQAAPSGSKVGCLEPGTWSATSPLTITTSDNGETWETDPTYSVNTAIIDGGNTSHIFNLNTNIQNFTVNGIKMQNVSCAAIITPSNSSTGNNVIIENNDIGNVVQNGPTCAAVVINNIKNVQYSHNYIHDTAGNGLDLRAYNAGDSIDGGLITGNVILRAISGGYTDQGSIYTNMIGSKNAGGHLTISNNFIRDWGSTSVTGGNGNEEGIYLDDLSSNVTVTGNIIGPPLHLATTNLNGEFLVNDDGNASYTGFNTIKNNILDLGTSANIFTGIIGGTQEIFSNNIVLSNFTGSLNTYHNGTNTGDAYWYDSATNNTISNNAYTNFAAGGSIYSNGNVLSDSSPQTYTSTQLACSGYLYTLNASSAVFSAPVSFPAIVGNWGPPGFTIPSSTNHSC